VGIYKTHNCTKSLTIDPNAFTVSSVPRPAEHDVVNTQATAVSEVI